jgi:hypothetical protein
MIFDVSSISILIIPLLNIWNDFRCFLYLYFDMSSFEYMKWFLIFVLFLFWSIIFWIFYIIFEVSSRTIVIILILNIWYDFRCFISLNCYRSYFEYFTWFSIFTVSLFWYVLFWICEMIFAIYTISILIDHILNIFHNFRDFLSNNCYLSYFEYLKWFSMFHLSLFWSFLFQDFTWFSMLPLSPFWSILF